MSQKRALILGINGQDGSYLADILLEKGYQVHGMVRRSSQPNLWRIHHCLEQLTIHQGDLLDGSSVRNIIWRVFPDEIYNMADQDHVGFSTATPSYSAAVTYGAVADLLETVKQFKSPQIKFFQPVSAMMFGDTPGPQNEESPFNPQSPYAISKLAAYHLCRYYREQYGLFISTAILFNHDSVRRQGDYLLHKICKAAVRISQGDQEYLTLSNPSMRVDIGSAKDYMQAVHQILQLPHPVDLVLGTDFAGSIESFVQTAFMAVHLSMEKFREIPGNEFKCSLMADSSKARGLINFLPQSTIYSLIRELVEHYTDILYRGK